MIRILQCLAALGFVAIFHLIALTAIEAQRVAEHMMGAW